MAVSQDRGGDQIVLKKLSREAIRQSVQLIPQEFLHAGLNRTVRLLSRTFTRLFSVDRYAILFPCHAFATQSRQDTRMRTARMPLL